MFEKNDAGSENAVKHPNSKRQTKFRSWRNAADQRIRVMFRIKWEKLCKIIWQLELTNPGPVSKQMRQPFYCRGTQLDGQIRIVFQNKWDSSHRHALKWTLKCKIFVVTFHKKKLTLKQKFLRKLLQKRKCLRKRLRKRNFLRKLSQKRKFSQKLSWKLKFFAKIFTKPKIFAKLAHFRIIFAFRENEP
jgi:hypothetical protein